MKKFKIFMVMAVAYMIIEAVFRLCTDPSSISLIQTLSMGVCGGLSGLFADLLNEDGWNAPMFVDVIIASLFTTSLEYAFGYVLNIKLGLNIWDYSNMPFNLNGQICLTYSIGWTLLMPFAFWLGDHYRHNELGEESNTTCLNYYKAFFTGKSV